MEEERVVTINNKQPLCHFCSGSEFKKIKTRLNQKWSAALGG